MLSFIISLIVIGAIAGFIARAIVPGKDAMSIPATILLGIVGSFVGGFLADVLFRSDAADRGISPSGIIGSIIGAILVLLVYRLATHRGAGTRRV